MWLGPASSTDPYVSDQEQSWACNLGQTGQRRFLGSRAWMRSCLSDLWGVPAQDIPLHAPPGKPPALHSGWGFVSLSHSKGSALMAWSSAPVGVDLERLDRPFASDALMNRYYASSEQRRLRSLPKHAFHQAVLEHWLIKEAAIKWQQGSLAQDLIALGCGGRWAECKPPGQSCSCGCALSPTRAMGHGDRVSLRTELDWNKSLLRLKSQSGSRSLLA